MRRLYLQIYLSLLGALVLMAILFAVTFRPPPDEQFDRMIDGIAELVTELLPPAGSPKAELQASLDRMAENLVLEATLYGPDRKPVVWSGQPLDLTDWGFRRRGWHRNIAVLPLPDGRSLALRSKLDRPSHTGWIGGLFITFVAVAIAAWPVARGLTRRLERLQQRVDLLGEGDLDARVEVEGKDEIASLARSFNRAADRIAALLAAQRRMLASASHELRTPLARLRVATELMGEAAGRDDLQARIEADIAELDELIGEILLASRVEAQGGEPPARQPVDLLALAAEESARLEAASGTDVTLSGEPVEVRGDERLLRRLLRNLLENARRHAGGASVEVVVEGNPDGVRVSVSDAGPGVPEGEREKIFEPFYRPPGAREGPEGGYGLGLALVRQIAEYHGGAVRCEPVETGGTRFCVDLPIYPHS